MKANIIIIKCITDGLIQQTTDGTFRPSQETLCPYEARFCLKVDDFEGEHLDQFIKTFFWNIQKFQSILYYHLIYKQMLENVFCSKIVPSFSFRNHVFYKAEYMGQSWLRQVWAITFDWIALAT